MTFQEAQTMYHSQDQKLFQAGFDGARRIKEQQLQTADGQPAFRPAGSVCLETSQARTVYYELGFVSETEFQQLTSMAMVKVPKKKSSLRGLSAEESSWLRKVRVERRVSTSHIEVVVKAGQQIRAQQPAEAFVAVC